MKKIKLENEKVVTVAKLPLKKYVELLKGLQELPKHLVGMDKVTNEELFAKLPDIIANALPDVARVLSIASDLKEEEVYELPLDEVVEIFVSVIEENKFAQIYERVKKVAARPAAEVRN